MLRKLLFANFKLVYRLSQWLRGRFTSNGMIILLTMLVAGVFGIDTRSTLSFQIFSITFILIVIAISYAFFFRGRYSIQRHLPDYATVDTPVHYSCTVNNHNAKAKKALVLIDNLSSPFPTLEMYKNVRDPLDKRRNRVDRFIGYPKLVNLVQRLRGASITATKIDYIAEKSKRKANIELVPKRRGYIYFDNTLLAQADPLGLFQAQKTYKNTDKLLVLPKIYNVPNLNLYGKRTYQHGGVNNASIVGDSQEFISLRDYRPGDPIKSIHWRSFAKSNKPIVKEFQDEFFIRYGLILDTYIANQADYLFEDAVSVAASFSSISQEQDALLDLMFIGNNAYRFTAGRGLLGTTEILEILACVEPNYQSNINNLSRLIRAHIRECSALICVMLELDEERIALLNQLKQHDVPIKVLLLAEETPLVEFNKPQLDIYTIRHNHIQTDLEKLS